MLPAGVARVIRREFIIELDIAGKADSNVRAFDQIMTQQRLFGKPAGQDSTEGTHIIDALAVVGAFTGDILIDVGNGLRIGIDSNRVREETAERRGARARQGGAHARLNDRVGAGQDIAFAVEARPVERVREGLDHPAGGVVGQLRVAIERDDEPHIRQMIRVADVHQPLGILGPRSIDQTIELFQLPAFALPSDEFPF